MKAKKSIPEPVQRAMLICMVSTGLTAIAVGMFVTLLVLVGGRQIFVDHFGVIVGTAVVVVIAVASITFRWMLKISAACHHK